MMRTQERSLKFRGKTRAPVPQGYKVVRDRNPQVGGSAGFREETAPSAEPAVESGTKG